MRGIIFRRRQTLAIEPARMFRKMRANELEDFLGDRIRPHLWRHRRGRITLPHATIISIANKLPEERLQEDEKLLTLYDLALTRTEED